MASRSVPAILDGIDASLNQQNELEKKLKVEKKRVDEIVKVKTEVFESTLGMDDGEGDDEGDGDSYDEMMDSIELAAAMKAVRKTAAEVEASEYPQSREKSENKREIKVEVQTGDREQDGNTHIRSKPSLEQRKAQSERDKAANKLKTTPPTHVLVEAEGSPKPVQKSQALTKKQEKQEKQLRHLALLARKAAKAARAAQNLQEKILNDARKAQNMLDGQAKEVGRKSKKAKTTHKEVTQAGEMLGRVEFRRAEIAANKAADQKAFEESRRGRLEAKQKARDIEHAEKNEAALNEQKLKLAALFGHDTSDALKKIHQADEAPRVLTASEEAAHEIEQTKPTGEATYDILMIEIEESEELSSIESDQLRQARKDQSAKDREANEATKQEVSVQLNREAREAAENIKQAEQSDQTSKEEDFAAKAAKKEVKRKRKAEKEAQKASMANAEGDLKSIPKKKKNSKRSLELIDQPDVSSPDAEQVEVSKHRKRKERVESPELGYQAYLDLHQENANKQLKTSASLEENQLSDRHVSDQPAEEKPSPLSWMEPTMRDSLLGTVKLADSGDVQMKSSEDSKFPAKHFGWLPSYQRENLLNTIKNSRPQISSSSNAHQQQLNDTPQLASIYDWNPPPKLFSSRIYKNPPPEPVVIMPTVNRSGATHTTIVPPVKNTTAHNNDVLGTPQNVSLCRTAEATPAILPPVRDYLVSTTPQTIVPQAIAKPAILPPNSTPSQLSISELNLASNTSSKATTILPPNITRSASTLTPKVATESPILPPSFNRYFSDFRPFGTSVILPPNFQSSPSTPKVILPSSSQLSVSSQKVILPASFQPSLSSPNTILPPTKIPQLTSIVPSTKFNSLSISEGTSTTNIQNPPAAASKSKNAANKRAHPSELPNEEADRETGNKRQKRIITSAGSPSPIHAPILPPKSIYHPAPKRNLDLILSKQEEWEVTSGRFRGRINLSEHNDDDAELEENIAFSSLYIQNRTRAISIANIKFSIIRLQSGESTDLTSPDEAGVKVCSVSRGRVKVNISGKKFSIGEDGMWRVRGGEKCKVRNQLSEEAVMHVSDVV